MTKSNIWNRPGMIPAAYAFLSIAALTGWLCSRQSQALKLRVPGADHSPESESGAKANPVLAGKLVLADGKATEMPGNWSRFRGPASDGVSPETTSLSRSFQGGAPRQLWEIEVGEGYAGAAVLHGRVYLMDYDRENKQDALRCLSLSEGREIWRYTYHVAIKRNHGMSRTVPAVTDKYVVAMGPKCHVVCLDATNGALQWGADLVRQFGATVPPWYAGQCPLIDNGAVILAPGGKDALLVALDLATGTNLWRSPNPHGWKMTHSSVMPMQFGDQRMYVYCADKGVAGISAKDGALLWETADWKISIATVPSPLILEDGKVFLSGGYNSGSLMLQLKQSGDKLVPETLFRLGSEVFGATQHTPIFYKNHLYGVRSDGKFVCLSLEGKPVWTSAAGQQFGLGSFLLGDGTIFAMNDSGLLRLIEAAPAQYHLLGEAQVLHGRESWAPMALAGGRILARDFTKMVCLDVAR